MVRKGPAIALNAGGVGVPDSNRQAMPLSPAPWAPAATSEDYQQGENAMSGISDARDALVLAASGRRSGVENELR